MELQFVTMAILGILGAALVVGGIVAFRGSARTGVRASAAAAISAGIVMWVIILLTTQVSSTSSGPQEPVVTNVAISE